jgi:hypothetical protein
VRNRRIIACAEAKAGFFENCSYNILTTHDPAKTSKALKYLNSFENCIGELHVFLGVMDSVGDFPVPRVVSLQQSCSLRMLGELKMSI